MRPAAIALIAALVITSALLAGCGGGGDGSGSSSYLPMAVGNSWDYTLTLAPGLQPAQIPGGTQFPYHETVTGIATLQDTRYFAIQARREAVGTFPERIWQQFRREDLAALYARVGDPAYDLPILMLPPITNETWTDPLFPDVTYTVVAVATPVTVPAGPFTCVRVDEDYDYVPAVGESPIHVTVRSFYARGVGLVRDETIEDGALTSTLELVGYSLE